jgi:hypothetical protein
MVMEDDGKYKKYDEIIIKRAEGSGMVEGTMEREKEGVGRSGSKWWTQ